MTFINKRNKHQ
ncbi:unnamed protein product, partial [Rotaria sordida]